MIPLFAISIICLCFGSLSCLVVCKILCFFVCVNVYLKESIRTLGILMCLLHLIMGIVGLETTPR